MIIYYLQCRDIGLSSHEELLKVLNELQSVSICFCYLF